MSNIAYKGNLVPRNRLKQAASPTQHKKGSYCNTFKSHNSLVDPVLFQRNQTAIKVDRSKAKDGLHKLVSLFLVPPDRPHFVLFEVERSLLIPPILIGSAVPGSNDTTTTVSVIHFFISSSVKYTSGRCVNLVNPFRCCI